MSTPGPHYITVTVIDKQDLDDTETLRLHVIAFFVKEIKKTVWQIKKTHIPAMLINSKPFYYYFS